MTSRVVVLSPHQSDKILALSTLPAVTRALTARGASARLHGQWDFDWQPGDLSAPRPLTVAQRLWRTVAMIKPGRSDPYGTYAPPDDRLGHPLHWHEPPDRLARLDAAFWSTLDLSATDLVVAPGWAVARRALEHPTRRPGTRVIVADFHMLDGVSGWADDRSTRAAATPWWPGRDLVVHACFPSFADLYARAGIPTDAITWMPYPLHVGHLSSAAAPTDSGHIFTGGRHDRDWATLSAAVDQLADLRHAVRIHAPVDAIVARPPIDMRGEVNVAVFAQAIATSRFTIVPLHGKNPTRAAGISVAALALAAGRPVIASDTQAMRDTVRDQVDGLLVPPSDARTLAQAIRRLDTDADELRRLSAGAAESAREMDVSAWAERILASG